jgi:hypothetical protein
MVARWRTKRPVADARRRGVPARIVHGHRLRCGGVVAGFVDGNPHHRGETGVLTILVDLEGGGQLHGVRGAERRPIRQPHGLVEEGG